MNKHKQAGAELGQAQDKLKVIVDVGVEVRIQVGVEVEVEINHSPWWVLDITKLMLNSTQMEDVVGDELGFGTGQHQLVWSFFKFLALGL